MSHPQGLYQFSVPVTVYIYLILSLLRLNYRWIKFVYEEYMYEGRSENNASYLFPWKLQKIQTAQLNYLIQQMLNYKTLLFNIVTTVAYAIWPGMNNSPYA
jgi:hypothetical protein